MRHSGPLLAAALLCPAFGQDAERELSPLQITADRDSVVQWNSVPEQYLTIERTSDLATWEPLATLAPVDGQYTDTAAGYHPFSFYRAKNISGTNILTGDHLSTPQGNITIHPVNHASFVMSWNGLMIYNDPVGGAASYKNFARADLILVSHDHSDHFDRSTLSAVRRTEGNSTIVIAPRAVYNALSADLKALTTVLANGERTNFLGLNVTAVPAYNSNHPKGTGNGYLVELGGRRLYMTGDTGALEEMKTLPKIDVAFVCMNVPYTMTVSQAATVVREFAPAVVYPYHYRNQNGSYSDLKAFRQQVGVDLGVEIRARKWY